MRQFEVHRGCWGFRTGLYFLFSPAYLNSFAAAFLQVTFTGSLSVDCVDATLVACREGGLMVCTHSCSHSITSKPSFNFLFHTIWLGGYRHDQEIREEGGDEEEDEVQE